MLGSVKLLERGHRGSGEQHSPAVADIGVGPGRVGDEGVPTVTPRGLRTLRAEGLVVTATSAPTSTTISAITQRPLPLVGRLFPSAGQAGVVDGGLGEGLAHCFKPPQVVMAA